MFAFAKTSDAQGFRGRGRVVVVGGFYANPYYLYDPWFGYEGQWGYPMYPPPYRYGFGQPDSSVRVEVKPKEAEVFVDGYYAGIVDDFDGVFQRLRVTPGRTRDRALSRRLSHGQAEGVPAGERHVQD